MVVDDSTDLGIGRVLYGSYETLAHTTRLDTYDRDEGGLNLEFLVNPLELEGVVSQLIIVLVPPASFENTRREILWDRLVLARVPMHKKAQTGSLSCC